MQIDGWTRAGGALNGRHAMETAPAAWRRILPHVAAAVATTVAVTAAAQPSLPAVDRTLAMTAKSSTIELAELEQAFLSMAERVSPSVVAITAGDRPVDPSLPSNSGDLTPAGLATRFAGGSHIVGTGFCIDPDGYIVTN